MSHVLQMTFHRIQRRLRTTVLSKNNGIYKCAPSISVWQHIQRNHHQHFPSVSAIANSSGGYKGGRNQQYNFMAASAGVFFLLANRQLKSEEPDEEDTEEAINIEDR